METENNHNQCPYFGELPFAYVADYGHCSARSDCDYPLIRPLSHCENPNNCGIHQIHEKGKNVHCVNKM